MKNISNYINEARQIQYTAALIGAEDSEGLPISVTILVDKADQKSFEDWANKEEGNTFSHIEGGNIEY